VLHFDNTNNNNGEEYEILKTVKNTVNKKRSENNEESCIDKIIRSLKIDGNIACDVTTNPKFV